MFVLALSLYNTWNRGVFLLCKITNLLIYRKKEAFAYKKVDDVNLSDAKIFLIKLRTLLKTVPATERRLPIFSIPENGMIHYFQIR